jgi:hypothetical protein
MIYGAMVISKFGSGKILDNQKFEEERKKINFYYNELGN